jgi:PEP-CTERM motif
MLTCDRGVRALKILFNIMKLAIETTRLPPCMSPARRLAVQQIGYNASYITDNGLFPNKATPPPNNGGPIFQMEVQGVPTPEPSTWALMIVGLASLGLLARRRPTTALAPNRA